MPLQSVQWPLQPLCTERSLRIPDLEIVGSKVSFQYHSHCSLQRLSEPRIRFAAIKNVPRSSASRQVSQRHVSVGEGNLKDAGSSRFPEVTVPPFIHEWTVFGNKCVVTPRDESRKLHKSVPCTKWISQEPRIVSLRPSFLPALQQRPCGATVTKQGTHRVKKQSFVESKQLTSSSKNDNVLSRDCPQYHEGRSSSPQDSIAQGITGKRRQSSTFDGHPLENVTSTSHPIVVMERG